MAITFTSEAAKRIAAAVRKVEQSPQGFVGSRTPAGPIEQDIWGWLTGCDLSGRRYSFVRVIPDASADEPDIIIDGGQLKYRILAGDPPHIHVAYEANGAQGIATGRVVRLTFAGYRPTDDGGQVPVYVFQYEKQEPGDAGLPVHDHRDNLNGGFAFGCYHPGTSLPQQPFSA